MITRGSVARPRTQHCLVGLLLTTAFVVGFAPRLAAQRRDSDRPEQDRPKQRQRGDKTDRISPERRKFFKSLSKDEKVKLRELYQLLKQRSPERWPRLLERLRRLPAEKRLQAITRAREQLLKRDPSRRQDRREWRNFEADLRRVEGEHRRNMRRNLPANLEKKLKNVDDPDERARIIRQHRRLRETRTDLIKELPEHLREHVRSLPPRDQAQFLRGYRGYLLFKRVFSSEAERKRILRGRPRQLRRILQQERLAPDNIQRPPFIPESTWRQWRELKPYQRLRILRTVIAIHRNGGRWSGPGADSKRSDRARPGSSRGGGR